MGEIRLADDSQDFGQTRNGASRRTAPYYRIIGQPPECRAGDIASAERYLKKIQSALEQGTWNPTHANRLRELRRLWAFRASGQDLRFNLVGTRDGRLPAEVERIIADTRMHRFNALKKQLCPQDARLRPYWETHGKAKGYPEGDSVPTDGMSDGEEPEAGIAWHPKQDAREYIVPGQDTHGHSVRIWCKVMPAHHRALMMMKEHKTFGFRTVGDILRWCVVRGVEELNGRAKLPKVRSAMHQADAIMKTLLDQAYYQDYAKVFEAMTDVIQKHASRGENGMVARLVGQIKAHIEEMDEPFWRDLWMTELQSRFGRYLDAKGATFDLGGESDGD